MRVRAGLAGTSYEFLTPPVQASGPADGGIVKSAPTPLASRPRVVGFFGTRSVFRRGQPAGAGPGHSAARGGGARRSDR